MTTHSFSELVWQNYRNLDREVGNMQFGQPDHRYLIYDY